MKSDENVIITDWKHCWFEVMWTIKYFYSIYLKRKFNTEDHYGSFLFWLSVIFTFPGNSSQTVYSACFLYMHLFLLWSEYCCSDRFLHPVSFLYSLQFLIVLSSLLPGLICFLTWVSFLRSLVSSWQYGIYINTKVSII